MSKSFRANVKTKVDPKAIREEERDGRKLIIVGSATLPDNVVMNRIKYPAAAIAKSFKSLERSPAPFGHPNVNGKFISAKDPEGLTRGWIGAWNENVRREDGRVFLDKVIDVEVANQTQNGRNVLAAIAAGEPVHTSTGVYFDADPAPKGTEDHDWVINAMTFDHDAILLGVPGAATPEQGVGMMVNAAGEAEEVEVVNSIVTNDDMEDDLDRAVEWAARALQRRQEKPMLSKVKAALIEAWANMTGNERATLNQQEEDMSTPTMEQFNALSETVKALSDTVTKLPETLGANFKEVLETTLKPVTDQAAANAADQKVKDDAEAAGLVVKIVAANLLSEADAKASPLPTLRALAANIKTKGADQFQHNSADKGRGYNVPKGE
jgi:hypothetical protein